MENISLVEITFTILDPKVKGKNNTYTYKDRFIAKLDNDQLNQEEEERIFRKVAEKIFSPQSKKSIKSYKLNIIRDMSNFIGLVKNPNIDI